MQFIFPFILHWQSTLSFFQNEESVTSNFLMPFATPFSGDTDVESLIVGYVKEIEELR